VKLNALFVSARRAPGVARKDPSLEALSNREFVREIDRRYGGIPEAVARDPELLQLLLPTLRADVTALESYRHEESSSVACPVHAFGGVQDNTVSVGELDRWQEVTRSRFHRWMFPGGHFFMESARGQVVDRLVQELAPTLTEPEPARSID